MDRTTVTVTIRADYLKAIALFMAKKDIRHYLKGLHIETGPVGSRMAATDGSILAVCRLPEDSQALGSIIIPAALVEQAVKATKGGACVVSFPSGSFDSKAPRDVTMRTPSGTYSAPELGGLFPDWRRVVPARVTGEAAHYDPELVAVVSKASAAVRGSKGRIPCIGWNGGGPGLVLVDDSFQAIVMPLRVKPEDTPTGCHYWTHHALTPNEAAATA